MNMPENRPWIKRQREGKRQRKCKHPRDSALDKRQRTRQRKLES